MTDPAARAALPADLSTVADHLTPILGRYFERSWSHGEGHRLYDTSGRAYLDFANGIAVTALGHHHPAVTAAIHAQVDRLIGPTGAMGYAEPVVRLASLLAATLPDPIDSVMFLNSGSEAIDGALKLARRVTGRPGIIAFRGGFHGRTFGATSVTTSALNYRTGYEPLLPGVYFAPYPAAFPEFDGDEERASAACLAILGSLFQTVIAPSQVGSILIEPVRGEGGYNPAPASFLEGLRRICDEHGILLIADEVQTGFARTGRMWGFEEAAIVPDVVVMAKAIANGLPLAAIATSRALMERWGKSAHGSTYGGNPVACAAAVESIKAIADPAFLARSVEVGELIQSRLRDLAGRVSAIGEVRGIGPMAAIELVTDRETREPAADIAAATVAGALERGLLLLKTGIYDNVLRVLVPISATDDDLETGLSRLEESLVAAS